MEETSTYLVWEGDVLEFNYKSQFLRVRSSQACQQTATARKRALADRNGRRAQRHGSGAAAWMLEKCKCKFTSTGGQGTTDAVTGPAARVAALHGGQLGSPCAAVLLWLTADRKPGEERKSTCKWVNAAAVNPCIGWGNHMRTGYPCSGGATGIVLRPWSAASSSLPFPRLAQLRRPFEHGRTDGLAPPARLCSPARPPQHQQWQ